MVNRYVNILSLAAALALAACQSATSGGSFCDLADVHRFEDATVNAMTDAEVAQEERHNNRMADLCGARPKG